MKKEKLKRGEIALAYKGRRFINGKLRSVFLDEKGMEKIWNCAVKQTSIGFWYIAKHTKKNGTTILSSPDLIDWMKRHKKAETWAIEHELAMSESRKLKQRRDISNANLFKHGEFKKLLELSENMDISELHSFGNWIVKELMRGHSKRRSHGKSK